MRRAAEAADAEGLALQVFDPLHVGARDQIMIGAVHGRHHDAHRQAGNRRADKVGKSSAVVDVARDHAVHDDLVLHDDDNGVETFAFEKAFFLGDDKGQRGAAVPCRQSESESFLSEGKWDR